MKNRLNGKIYCCFFHLLQNDKDRDNIKYVDLQNNRCMPNDSKSIK